MPNVRLVAAVLAALPAPASAAGEVEAPVLAVQSAEATVAAAPAQAGTDAAAQPTLDELRWVARPVVVFADTPNDPRFIHQLSMLEAGRAELEDRLVVVLTDADPAARGPLRRELRPRDFGLVLIDTDGTVVQRRPAPTSVRELTGMIDRLPSRRQETGSRRQ